MYDCTQTSTCTKLQYGNFAHATRAVEMALAYSSPYENIISTLDKRHYRS